MTPCLAATTLLRAVALAKGAVRGDGMKGESAITKVQNFEDDDVLFQFCK